MISKDLFDKYTEDSDLLIDLLQESKGQVFDYLMYMVGEKLYCLEVIDEVYQAILSSGKNYFAAEDFLASVFKTARNFSIDRFEEKLVLKRSELEGDNLIAFDYLSNLPPSEREILVLNLRCGFDKVFVSELTGFSDEQVEGALTKANEVNIVDIPNYNMPVKPDESHIAVSEIALDIKKQSRKPLNKWYLILLFALGAYFWKEILSFLKSFF